MGSDDNAHPAQRHPLERRQGGQAQCMSICRFQFKARGKQYVLADEHDQEVARLNAEVERLKAEPERLLYLLNQAYIKNDRLRRAGDEVIHEWSSGNEKEARNFLKALVIWNVAKECKPTE